MPGISRSIPDFSDRYLNEIAHGRQIAEHADTVWGWGRPTGAFRLKRRTDLLIHHGQLESGKTVLELGCGTGAITDRLARSGARIIALDISPDLLDKARTRGLPGRVTFQLGNAENLDFPDRAFDAVVGSSVLHHLDIGRTLEEICRVLKPDGRVAFSEPNMLNPHIFIQKNVPWIKRLAKDTPDETAFFRWPLSRRLRQTGFRDIEIVPYDFLHPFVPSSLITPVTGLGALLERVPFIREIAGSLIIGASKS